MPDIPLPNISDNPFNSRARNYGDVKELSQSLESHGLLSAVLVRESACGFQLVFGHRRVRAARSLGWSTIKADIGRYSDEQMLQFSLAENMLREDLSDFEKGLCFEKLHTQFGKTHEEIGALFGLSREHISNYIRMVHMFGVTDLKERPDLANDLHHITEHHARLLLEIVDGQSRALALKIVVSEGLSVRDLRRLIHRFRSWFGGRDNSEPNQFSLFRQSLDKARVNSIDVESEKIENILKESVLLPSRGNFDLYSTLYAFNSNYTLFSRFPPLERLEGSRAYKREKELFHSIFALCQSKIHDIRIQLFGPVAIATFYVTYSSDCLAPKRVMKSRATVVLAKMEGEWKITHEHYSPLQ